VVQFRFSEMFPAQNGPPLRLDLDLNKGSLIVSRKRETHHSSSTKAILQRKNTEGITDEQIIRIRKTMSRLLEIAPIHLTPEMKKAKAFMIWAEKLPLMQKCDELVSQLRERSFALTTIKESYLRDVVRSCHPLPSPTFFSVPSSLHLAYVFI
jgi:hypothetical protein